ncbi:hypothetical protein NKH71_26700 [Mesorhizobium sp. M0983]|uniref:hypothetical protein n=1 Tax=Mesorhizobium sp. M0983 TaxID=2957040 RepID=UPI003337305F
MFIPTGALQIAHAGWTLTGMLSNPYFAIGSGAQQAQAVLEFGGTPEQAVEIACKLDWASRAADRLSEAWNDLPCPEEVKRKRK